MSTPDMMREPFAWCCDESLSAFRLLGDLGYPFFVAILLYYIFYYISPNNKQKHYLISL